jgi:hypothetical protein
MELYNIGLGDSDIDEMLEQFPEIGDLSKNDIKEKEIILNELGCSNDQISNIFATNPEYLIRTNIEIIKLINKLLKLGFRTPNILLDTNPFILNLDPSSIDNYINKRIKNGDSLKKIIDDLDSDPYLFNEV